MLSSAVEECLPIRQLESVYLVSLHTRPLEAVDCLGRNETVNMGSVMATRVLIVDDCQDLADSGAALLRAAGFTVEVAYQGLDAIARAASFRPEVVLLDLFIPRMNGLDVARQLREKLGSAVVLVACSGWDGPAALRAVTEAGFDEFASKPANLLEVAVQSAALYRKKLSGHEPSSSSPPPKLAAAKDGQVELRASPADGKLDFTTDPG